MDDFLVSVVIPVHNGAGYIGAAVDSALMQDVSVEVLVIDDGSADNLDEVMSRYQNEPRVRYLKNACQMGVAKTRNHGVAMAHGDYIAFLDADDYWMKGKLKKQLKLMQETETVLCCTARELMTSDGRLTGHVIPVKSHITYQDMLFHNQINCSSVLMETSVARQFPMHHDDSHEDYLMWLEVLEKYRVASAINEPLLKYRVAANSKSGNKLKSVKMTFKTYRYMGYGVIRSWIQTCSHVIHGLYKYAVWF